MRSRCRNRDFVGLATGLGPGSGAGAREAKTAAGDAALAKALDSAMEPDGRLFEITELLCSRRKP